METIIAPAENDAGHNSDIDGQAVSVVQVASLGGQPVQVQSVIHNQPSVIQTAGGQVIHAIQVSGVGSDGDNDDDAESRKRREILARRPSYRKILNDLSGTDAQTITVAKIEEESDGHDSHDDEEATNLTTSVAGLPIQTVVPAGTIQIAAEGSTQGLQTLTMTNTAQSQAQGGATIVQYAQAADGQFFIPAGNVQYQIAPTSLPQGVVMATAGSTIASNQQISEEAARKRELRLLKNRQAASECRRKKKDYIKCLENRVAVLENQNKTLIDELKSLKELYCQHSEQS